jgi:mono/diheme cytochrome c family protein
MILLSVTEFTGRFHPILVHLPIGILLLGCFFQLLTLNSRFSGIKASISIIYLLGALSAVLSSISGYMLSQSGDYDAGMVATHQWLGIGVCIVSLLSYILSRIQVREVVLQIAAGVLIILITLTGHFGGSLTHGSDYISSALNDDEKGKAAIPPIADVQRAEVYTHMVQPLLQNRCYSCHGSEKQKGKLRLDTKEFIIKGGEEGLALVPGSPEESALIKRLLLPISNEDHMPPKEKPQLTAEEIALLQWWVSSGGHFDKKVMELKQTEDVKATLLSFQTGAVKEKPKPKDIPDEEVKRADEETITKLKQAGVIVIPVLANSNYLSVSFVTARPGAAELKLLESLKKQVIWLNMSNTPLTDQGMEMIARLDNLIRINLSRTAITDKGLGSLKENKRLQYLNLVGTRISAKGLEQLKELKELNSIYLYQSAVKINEWPQLKKTFSKVNLDSGGYTVPTLPTDTSIVKPPPPKK